MELFHYIQVTSEGLLSRVLTTSPTPGIMRAYMGSMVRKTVVPVDPNKPDGTRVLALDTGDWRFPVLERAMDKGVEFHIQSYDLKVVSQWEDGYLDQMVQKANFAWATASNLIVVHFANHKGFDLEPLGIRIQNTKKLTKRLGEVLRCSGHYHRDEYGELDTLEFVTPDDGEDVDYDGMNVISDSLCERMGFDGDHGWLRFLTKKGLIKGDFIRRPDDFFPEGIHVIYHTENLKPEFATTGWQLAMAMKHGPAYDLNHNDQVRFMVPSVFTRKSVDDDLVRLVHDWRNSVGEEDGELHKYLSSSQGSFDDPIAVDLRSMARLSDKLEDIADLMKSMGVPPAVMSNITFTRTGALVRMMQAGRMKDSNGRYLPSFRRMFIPASRAFSAAVISWAAYHEMAGLEFDEEDGSRAFFDPRRGFVVPTQRFRDTYELHGGQDLDDTNGVYEIFLWSSDPDKTRVLLEHHVLDPSLDVPDSPAEAIQAGLVIRMPMGPGEYSIERISPDMPWRFMKNTKPRVIDLATLPNPFELVFADADPVELTSSVSYDVPFNKEFATQMVRAQLVNPDVGPYANLIMSAAAVFGPDNIPADIKTLRMEETIDTVQQEADMLKFSIISTAVSQGWLAFVDHVLSNEIEVDKGLLATRIPMSVIVGDELVPVGQAILDAKLFCNGDTKRLHERTIMAINALEQAARDEAKKTRNETELARRIARFSVPKELKTFAIGWLRNCNGALKSLDNKYRDEMKKYEGEDALNAIVRRELQIQRRVATEKLMDKWVDAIITNDKYDTLMQVMALYHTIITTKSESHPHGDNDRVMVQPCSEGHITMMELFLQACVKYGLTTADVTLKDRYIK